MQEKDVMQMLQHERHDTLNHLQIIQGYLSMGKMDKVKDKVASWMGYFDEERKLFHLQAPLFTLWLMQFNHLHNNLRLTYYIEAKRNLQVIDQQLAAQCKQIITCIEREADQSVLYEGKLEVNEKPGSSTVHIRIIMDGPFQRPRDLKNKLVNMNGYFPTYIEEIENGIGCTFSFSCDG